MRSHRTHSPTPQTPSLFDKGCASKLRQSDPPIEEDAEAEAMNLPHLAEGTARQPIDSKKTAFANFQAPCLALAVGMPQPDDASTSRFRNGGTAAARGGADIHSLASFTASLCIDAALLQLIFDFHVVHFQTALASLPRYRKVLFSFCFELAGEIASRGGGAVRFSPT